MANYGCRDAVWARKLTTAAHKGTEAILRDRLAVCSLDCPPRTGTPRDDGVPFPPYLLEEHDLGRRLFEGVQRHLAAQGLKLATGTLSMRR